MSAYYISLWSAALAIALLCLTVIFFLLLANLARSIHIEREKVSFCWLRLIHLTSAVEVILIIVKHVGIIYNLHLCRTLGYIFFVVNAINRFWICLLWESHYRMVCIAMQKRRTNTSCSGAIFLGQVLVLIPFLNIPINLWRSNAKLIPMWNGKYDCIAYEHDQIDWLTIALEFSANIAFLALFLLHLFKVQGAKRELEKAVGESWKNSEFGKRTIAVCDALKRFAIRRVAVTSTDALWFIITICLLNSFPSGRDRNYNVYTLRMVLSGHIVSNNIVLYLMLSDYALKRFLWCNCGKNKREVSCIKEVPLLPKIRKKSTRRTLGTQSSGLPLIGKSYSRFMTFTTIHTDQSWALRFVFAVTDVSISAPILLESYESNALSDEDGLLQTLLEEDDYLGLDKADLMISLNKLRIPA